MYAISRSANKTFLARHLLDDYSDGKMEFLKGEQLEQIQDKFYELNFPNVRNFVVSFKHCLGGGYIDSILELQSKSQYDYIQKCYFPRQVLGQKLFIFKMYINGVGSGVSPLT